MNFLKALGQTILQGGKVLQNVLPIGAAVATVINPGLGLTISELGGIIASVESVGQTLAISGPDKLKAATPLIAQAILQSPFMSSHRIADLALFNQAAQEFAQATVDLLNALDSAGLQTTSKP